MIFFQNSEFFNILTSMRHELAVFDWAKTLRKSQVLARSVIKTLESKLQTFIYNYEKLLQLKQVLFSIGLMSIVIIYLL